MRKATLEDADLLRDAVNWWALQAAAYPMPVQPNTDAALDHILYRVTGGNVYIGHGAILIVSELTPWYGNETVLQEELILRACRDKPVYLRSVIRFIVELARERQVDYCLSGNTSPDPRLSALYKRAGFTHVTDVFYRSPHG